MVHKDGDTAQFLREQGVGRIAPLDAPDEIAAEFRSFLAELGSRTAGVLPIDAVRQYSRETRAAELASVLDTIAP